MGDTVVSQLTVAAAAEGGPDARASQLYVLAAGAYPTEAIEASQGVVLSGVYKSVNTVVSQAVVMVAARGRIANPQLRVWTFTLDGHDFYVLRLGERETLVYDLYSEQWSDWGSGSAARWRANTGANWIGGGVIAGGYGSNIVVGDDTHGTVFFLDPEYAYDDDPLTGSADQAGFVRMAQGQLPLRGRDAVPCYGVILSASFGYEDALGGVQLEISDDAGESYTDCGTVTIALADYAARVEWTSLGSITAPGRLFRLTDSHLARIDGLDLYDAAESE